MLQVSNRTSGLQRKGLAALCLSAVIGLGGKAPGQEPVIDIKGQVLNKIDKTFPDVIAPDLSKLKVFSSIAQLEADSKIKLLGALNIFAVGSRLSDSSDAVRNPASTIANRLKLATDFELPIKLEKSETAQLCSFYQQIDQAPDKGVALSTFISPSRAILATKYAYGSSHLTVLDSRVEVVNTEKGTAFGVRIRKVQEDRMVGTEGGGGPWASMVGHELTVVIRSFSNASDAGEALSLTVLKTDGSDFGLFYPDGISPQAAEKDNKTSHTTGSLSLYTVGRPDGSVEFFGNWLEASNALPDKFKEVLNGEVRAVTEPSAFDSFFVGSVHPGTQLIQADIVDQATGEKRSPVDPKRLAREGVVFGIPAIHLKPIPNYTLGVFSPRFKPSDVMDAQGKLAKGNGWVNPFNSAAMAEPHIGSLVTNFFPDGRPKDAYFCGVKGFIPAITGTPKLSGPLIKAANSALQTDVTNSLDGLLPKIYLERLASLLAVRPPEKGKKVDVKLEHTVKAPGGDKQGMVKRK